MDFFRSEVVAWVLGVVAEVLVGGGKHPEHVIARFGGDAGQDFRFFEVGIDLADNASLKNVCLEASQIIYFLMIVVLGIA